MAKAQYFVPNERPWFKSYPKGVSYRLDYAQIPVFQVLKDSANNYPDNSALIFYGKELSYKELENLSNKFAKALQDLGIKKGDRIALLLPNCPQFVISFFAALKIGAIVSPLNPLYSSRELAELLDDSKAETVITLKRFFPKIDELKENNIFLKNIIITNIGDYLPFHLNILLGLKTFFQNIGKNIKTPDFNDKKIHRFKDLIESSDSDFEKVEINPEQDIAVLMYTSGTTGKPKGAMLTHFNLVANVFQIFEYLEDVIKVGEDVELGVLPFFHIYGLNFVMNFAIKSGFCIILFPEFHTKPVCEAIQKYKITIVPAIPAILSAILRLTKKQPGKYDFSSVRFWGSGADSCPVSVIREIEKLGKGTLVEAYGLTETSPVTHMNPPKGVQKPGSIGIPLSDTDHKIVHLQTRQELPQEEVGELLIRGPQVFKGYWENPKATQEVLDENGWFRTKDIVYVDEQGYVYIKGRVDDMINVRGEKVWPREIEEVLKKHKSIKDAAVIAIKHDYFGQAPKAFVITEKGKVSKQELIEFCKKELTKYKVPREIEFVNEIPKSHIGKTLHYVLRKKQGG